MRAVSVTDLTAGQTMTGLIGATSNFTRQRTAKILVVDDEPNVRSALYSLLGAVHK